MKKNPKKYSAGKLICFSLFVSVCICSALILAANDAFALVSADQEKTVTILENTNTENIARILAEQGLIRFPLAYRFYAKIRSFGENYLAGDFVLNSAMGYDELRNALSPKKETRLQKRITIPEGLTTDEIIEIFVSEGIGTREGFR